LISPAGSNSSAIFPPIDDVLAVGGGSNFLSGPDTGIPHNSEWTALPAQKPRFWGDKPVPFENPPQVNPNPINNQPNENNNNGGDNRGAFNDSNNLDLQSPPLSQTPVQQVSVEFWNDDGSWLSSGEPQAAVGNPQTVTPGTGGNAVSNDQAAFSSPRPQGAKTRGSGQIQPGHVVAAAAGMAVVGSRRRIEDKPSASHRHWGIERLER
jgi:hypothetical protein